MFKIAKVAIPISLDKTFDYTFSLNLKLNPGMRVHVDFRGKKRVGFVVALAESSKLKKLKPIIDVLDSQPLLGNENIEFAKQLSKFYPYSSNEFIFMMIPAYLKKARKYDQVCAFKKKPAFSLPERKYIRAEMFSERYCLWRDRVKEKLNEGSVLICFPQLSYLFKAKQLIEKDFSCPINLIYSQKNEKELLSSWAQSREKSLILGTRLSIFYYPSDLKLIIVEEENSQYYFQEEKPFHNLVDVAFMLSKRKKIDLFLSGDYPTLATYRLIQEDSFGFLDKKSFRENIKAVNIAEFSKSKVVSPVLIELIRKDFKGGKKTVVLWNKKGFSRVVSCSSCGHIFKCDHCSGFLQLSSSGKEGVCPYCRRKKLLQSLCSYCKEGYLKASGFGIERIGLSLKKVFPEAQISTWQDRSPKTQIVLSTSKILSFLYGPERFDNGYLLDADAFLMRTDYEATFNAFLYFKKLSHLFKGYLYVFTRNKDYPIFRYLNQNWSKFYKLELRLRKKLGLPPFGHIIKITLRAKNKTSLFKSVNNLYDMLSDKFKDVYGPFEEQPFKLRDNFRYSLTIKADRDFSTREKLKEKVDSFRNSNIKLAVVIR